MYNDKKRALIFKSTMIPGKPPIPSLLNLQLDTVLVPIKAALY